MIGMADQTNTQLTGDSCLAGICKRGTEDSPCLKNNEGELQLGICKKPEGSSPRVRPGWGVYPLRSTTDETDRCHCRVSQSVSLGHKRPLIKGVSSAATSNRPGRVHVYQLFQESSIVEDTI